MQMIIYGDDLQVIKSKSDEGKHNSKKLNAYRKSGDSWKPLAGWRGLSGKRSKPSLTLLLGLGVASACKLPFLNASTFFFTRPRLFSNLLVSIDVALNDNRNHCHLPTSTLQLSFKVLLLLTFKSASRFKKFHLSVRIFWLNCEKFKSL